MEELEPRMFSFDNPHGACPRCTGLGEVLEIAPELVIPDESLSIQDGAVRPWSIRRVLDGMYRKALLSVCKHYKQSPSAAWGDLPEEFRRVLLYGSGGEEIAFSYAGVNSSYQTRRPFEGVIPNLERRFRDTDSARAREMITEFMASRPCPACGGARLRPESCAVRVGGETITGVTALSISKACDFFEALRLDPTRAKIAERIIKEIRVRLGFLNSVGLNYLSLDRQAGSLSGGESQRIRLATQVGSGLVGVLYILDEPSIGLHQRDNRRLIKALMKLRDAGNTVLVVEHDQETILSADWLVDLGPGAGREGGHLLYSGPLDQFMEQEHQKSLTWQYLKGIRSIPVPKTRRPGNGNVLRVSEATGNNLKNITVDFPLGCFICVTGVSGSGKSSLVNETLVPVLARKFYRSKRPFLPHGSVTGIQHIDKVVEVDQSPIGKTPRSNPATYTNVFAEIRKLFAASPDARTRGFKSSRFSFNIGSGRCEACKGAGIQLIEMNFLPDVHITCPDCQGKRYKSDTLAVRYKDKNIYQVLDMTVNEAVDFFRHVPSIIQKIKTLQDVGLGYIKLGQPSTTLSGGECQRVKLAAELSRTSTGKTLYILDEPTTGLHSEDVKVLLNILHQLTDKGNTIVIIEHHPDIICSADHVIDLGPEGGEGGGQVVGTGTPEEMAKNLQSYTGSLLREWLKL